MVAAKRRQFLQLAAGAAGSNLLPLGVRQALAIPARRETGTIRDIKHIVVLMQENRSFDHYFGTLRGVRGFGDPRPAVLPGGRPVWYQPSAQTGAGYVLPFRPDLPDLGLQFLEGTPHDWNSSHVAWNEGRYNQWIAAKGQNTMAYFQREDIPYHFALADAFTVCDAYHCSMMGPTDPNRYHLWTGWVGNDGSGGGPVISNAEAGYDWQTFPERLQGAGISWKIYQDIGTGLDANGYWGWTDDPYIGNYGDNSLLYFHQYQNAAPGTPLYDNARTGTNVAQHPEQSFFDILKADVAQGTLPQVSWIIAPEAYSEHPNWPANYGAWYTSQVLEILTSNPELWSQTALFITFDENDGFFDHMLPPFPAGSTAQGASTVDVSRELYAGDSHSPAGPYGLGQRVPMTIVSPWTKGGWVCSEVFDHASLIRFIEARFGADHPSLIETNITPWRRAVCGDLTSAFNFRDPDAHLQPLPETSAYVPADTQRHPSYDPVPPADQQLPVQEPGLRRSRALPYALSTHGQLNADASAFEIEFGNQGSAAAVWLVSRPGSDEAPRSYTVEPGKSLQGQWALDADGRYDLLASGPNGYTRRFRGDARAALRAEVRCTTQHSGHEHSSREHEEHGHARDRDRDDGRQDRRLWLQLSNPGAQPVTLTVTPQAYTRQGPRSFTLAPGAVVVDHWELSSTLGWYDLAVHCDASPDYLRRLAGRVENGRPSVSDPAIVTRA